MTDTPDTPNCPAATAQLADLFNDIYQQRMQDMPMINPQLSVQAVDFQVWQQDCVGVLISPWFMNLVILPSQADPALKIGQKLVFNFPAGEYEFVVNREAPVGFFYTCSLFSPMFNFTEQSAAVATASAVMELLFKAPEPQANAPEDEATTENADISRRDLLRGRLKS